MIKFRITAGVRSRVMFRVNVGVMFRVKGWG